MNNQSPEKLFAYLLRYFLMVAPVALGRGRSRLQTIAEFSLVDWSGSIPQNSWKEFFLPAEEVILTQAKNRLVKPTAAYPAVACWAMNILDLKAVTLLDQVFSHDVYYQERRSQLLLVGYSAGWPTDYKQLRVFSHNWEENILEHTAFDIFLVRQKDDSWSWYTGSAKGRKIMENAGLKKYRHVAFAGQVAEEGPDKKMLALKAKMEKSFDYPLWDQLAKICLACGKCSAVCPTCFCFDLLDNSDPDGLKRHRCLTSCFFDDFSKVAGGHRDLDSIKKRLYFWYYHKLVRIPQEYQIPGCVACGRCVKACPVGIDIFANIQKLLNGPAAKLQGKQKKSV